MRIQDLRENTSGDWMLRQKLPASLPILIATPIKNRKNVVEAINEIANRYQEGYDVVAKRITRKGKLYRITFQYDVFALSIAGIWEKVRRGAAMVEDLQNDMTEESIFMDIVVNSLGYEKYNDKNYREAENINKIYANKVREEYGDLETYFKEYGNYFEREDYRDIARNQLKNLLRVLR